MKIHHVKINRPYLIALLSGRKPFEFRKNDRDYQPGDLVRLYEVVPDNVHGGQAFTGRTVMLAIDSVYHLGDIDPAVREYVVFTFRVREALRMDPEYAKERYDREQR